MRSLNAGITIDKNILTNKYKIKLEKLQSEKKQGYDCNKMTVVFIRNQSDKRQNK